MSQLSLLDQRKKEGERARRSGGGGSTRTDAGEQDAGPVCGHLHTLVVPVVPLGSTLASSPNSAAAPSEPRASPSASTVAGGTSAAEAWNTADMTSTVLCEAHTHLASAHSVHAAASSPLDARPHVALHPAPSIHECWQLSADRQGQGGSEAFGSAAVGGGALLVRPDGHVAWRHRGAPASLSPTSPCLVHLAKILGARC